MDMHSESMVVTIRDTNTNKTFREYDHARSGWESKSRIALQDGTEYCFVLKNLSAQRRRVSVTIDGTVVGEGFIVPANSEVVLERFLESDKRFKAVLKDNPAVQDPTNSDNGKVVIKVWTESLPIVFELGSGILGWPKPWVDIANPFDNRQWHYLNQTYGSAGLSGDSSYQACNLSCSVDQPVHTADTEPMATVEGSKSNQTFSSVYWRGDSYVTPVTFCFHLTKATAEPKTGFCTDCGTKLVEGAKFCQDCGTRVKR